MKTYDAIIIGSGQGGGPLAHKLADLNWSVAFLEREYLGGSCINFGCTPTKTMMASARIAHYARRAADYGVHTEGLTINLPEIVARKNKIVHQWRSGQQKHAAKRPTLDLYRGHGRFTDPHTVEVNGEVLTSDRIFINTGTRPRLPDLPGLGEVPYLTNKTIMDLTDVPEHLIVLGASYIGLEFGQMFRRFGSQVTVVEVNARVAYREDEDVAQTLQEALEAEGMRFCLNARATEVHQTEDGLAVAVAFEDGQTETLAGSHLLVAIGRTPNTDDLGLDAAGIEARPNGTVVTNDRLETNVPGVWALGDVKGGPAFTNISYDDHLILYDNLVHGTDRTINGRQVPYALFTDPELGRVGMTEREAREAGYTLKVGKIPMARVARAIERDETAGLMKVVINAGDDRILGATILGPEGGEVVQILMAVMMADAPWTLLKRAVYAHPTLAEGFYALMESVKPVDAEAPPAS